MNLKQLRDAARDDLDDGGTRPLFIDAWLNRRINQAANEAARRARLIEDSETVNDGATPTPSPICVHSVTQGQRTITLDARIILVKRVKLASLDLPTPRQHRADLDLVLPGWETSTQGDVVAYCTDFTKGKLYFVNPFPSSDTVTLTVIREPLATLAADADVPEIAPRYHESLLHWVRYCAHSRTDVEDVYDLKKAQEQLALFEQEFGKRSSAIDETWIEREQMYDGYDGTF
jgi:hypothetical protein